MEEAHRLGMLDCVEEEGEDPIADSCGSQEGPESSWVEERWKECCDSAIEVA